MADISSITLPGGGTYDLKDKNAVPKYGMGKNLIRNWYFVGGGTGRGVFPVNQRGQSSYTAIGYTVDGWWNRGPLAVTVGSDSITISNTSGNTNWVQQFLPDLPEETFAISILVTAVTGTVTLVMQTTTSPFQTPALTENLSPGCIWASGSSVSGRKYRVGLYVANNSSVTFKAVKLELGTEQTLAHQENGVWVLNDVPDYEYELYRCITSTADPSDTYANKSLATEQQLAFVESGTTASRAYAVGEYFCWNGLLYWAKTAISSGASFTVNTNCEQVTGGGINAIAPKQLLNENITGAGNYSVPSLRAYNLFIVQVQGNIVNFRTLVVPPGVSTQINVDATASIYAHVTMMIDLINNSVNVTSFNISGWGQAELRVWGVSLPL